MSMLYLDKTCIAGLVSVDLYEDAHVRPFRVVYEGAWVEVRDARSRTVADAFLRGEAMAEERAKEAGQFLLDLCNAVFGGNKESI